MGNLRRGMVDAMLTDLYQLTMAYSYWEHGRADEPCAFEMFYRKSPFGGEFSIFAGLREFLGYLREFGFGEEDVEVLREVMPGIDEGFFEWLKGCNASKLVVRAMKEGSVVFPGEPLVTVEGPLAVVQLVETTLLNLTNFSSLVCTNAVRHRIAAGPQAKLVEFGLRRAQGPNGGVTASVYSYVGGFDATSNVQAGKLFKIPLRGTHAHSFVQSYSGTALKTMGRTLRNVDGEDCDLVGCVLKYRERLGFTSTNDGELAAFIAFAQCFPSGFVALIDTYDPVLSGARNFILVALALFEFGYKPVGVRLDSGDLAALSVAVREEFQSAAGEANCEQLVHCQIMASNNINEDFLLSLKEKKHELTAFGIGTNLVTCQKQPALGCVFKLVEISSMPRMKVSENKISLPCAKRCYRLLDEKGIAFIDVLTLVTEPVPQPNVTIVVYEPLDQERSFTVTPSKVRELQYVCWPGREDVHEKDSIEAIRSYAREQLTTIHERVLRLVGAERYPVAVSSKLREVTQSLIKAELGALNPVS